MILHIVLYQPKITASAEELLELSRAIEKVCRDIPTIKQSRVGKASNFGFAYKTWPYDQNIGYMAMFEFDDFNGLREYLDHPSHKELAKLFWSTCDKPIILDVSAISADGSQPIGLLWLNDR